MDLSRLASRGHTSGPEQSPGFLVVVALRRSAHLEDDPVDPSRGEAAGVLHVLTCISYGRRGTPSNQWYGISTMGGRFREN